MYSKITALVLLAMTAGSVRAQPGTRLSDDPSYPVPLYHPRGGFATTRDWLITAQPVVAAASARLGVVAAPIALFVYSDAFCPRESHGALNRIAHYGKLLEDFVRSRYVKTGMTANELQAMLGRCDGISTGIDGVTEWYEAMGLLVYLPHQFPSLQPRVSRVSWHFTGYSPKPTAVK